MKTIKEILNNYNEYETFLQDRFGIRFCDFLTEEQASKIGFGLTEDAKEKGESWKIIPWTEENILKHLKQDVEFGWEKAIGQRGISSNLMFEVVVAWCKVLENGLADEEPEYYGYGCWFFEKVAEYYGWELDE